MALLSSIAEALTGRGFDLLPLRRGPGTSDNWGEAIASKPVDGAIILGKDRDGTMLAGIRRAQLPAIMWGSDRMPGPYPTVASDNCARRRTRGDAPAGRGPARLAVPGGCRLAGRGASLGGFRAGGAGAGCRVPAAGVGGDQPQRRIRDDVRPAGQGRPLLRRPLRAQRHGGDGGHPGPRAGGPACAGGLLGHRLRRHPDGGRLLAAAQHRCAGQSPGRRGPRVGNHGPDRRQTPLCPGACRRRWWCARPAHPIVRPGNSRRRSFAPAKLPTRPQGRARSLRRRSFAPAKLPTRPQGRARSLRRRSFAPAKLPTRPQGRARTG